MKFYGAYVNNPDIINHAGAIVFDNCRFTQSSKSAIHIHDNTTGAGMFVVRNSYFEGIPGLVMTVDTFARQFGHAGGIMVYDSWIESTGEEGIVHIDGKTYNKANTFHFNSSTDITLRNLSIINIKLENSTVNGEKLIINGTTDIDSNSVLVVNDARRISANLGMEDAIIANISTKGVLQSSSSFTNIPHRNWSMRMTDDNIIASNDFSKKGTFGALPSDSIVIVEDGVRAGKKCTELRLNGTTIVSGASFWALTSELHQGDWVVFTGSYKNMNINDETFRFSLQGNQFWATRIYGNQGQWMTVGGLHKIDYTPTAAIMLYFFSQTGRVRLADWQILRFDTKTEAQRYLDSKAFAVSGETSFIYQSNATDAQTVINVGDNFNDELEKWKLTINGTEYSHGLTGSEISSYDGSAGTITLVAGLSAGDRIIFRGQKE